MGFHPDRIDGGVRFPSTCHCVSASRGPSCSELLRPPTRTPPAG